MEEKNILDSAINPFALAEAISEKKISWGSDLNSQKKKLSSTLGLSEQDIFGEDSPILHPFFKPKTMKAIGIPEAKKQLEEFLGARMKPLQPNLKKTAANEEKRVLALAKKERILNFVFKATKESYSTGDVTPANCTWKDNGIFFKCAAEGDDPIQGSLGDCYFIAALAAVAWAKPYSIINRASLCYCDSEGDAESNIRHQIDFFKQASNGNYSTKVALEVSDFIPILDSTKTPLYAKSFDSKETWPSVYEKAYAKYRVGHTGDKPDYSLIGQGGCTEHTIGEITGGKVTVKWHSSTSASALLKFIQSNCYAWTANDFWGKDGYSHRLKYPMVAGHPTSNDCGVVSSHSYSILGFDHDDKGQYYVVLRNPWGRYPATKDVKTGNWNVISYRQGYGSMIPLNVTGSTSRWGGIFALKIETYLKIFGCTAVSVY